MLEKIKAIIHELNPDCPILDVNSPLVGSNRCLDSLGLVELCLKLEDLASMENFNFDWMSADAMSKSKGMFTDIGSLCKEYAYQRNSSK